MIALLVLAVCAIVIGWRVDNDIFKVIGVMLIIAHVVIRGYQHDMQQQLQDCMETTVKEVPHIVIVDCSNQENK